MCRLTHRFLFWLLLGRGIILQFRINYKLIFVKDFIKKYWEGALVAQMGLGFILYEHFNNNEISSVGISIFVIGNIILLGKLFYKK